MLEDLLNFLRGTFHQDIDSPESAIEQFIEDVGHDYVQYIARCIEEFLNSNLTIEEKNIVIETNTEIYFPYIAIMPLEWIVRVYNLLITA